jgi:pimeloyl-ACP methyl ester carboxylesterase
MPPIRYARSGGVNVAYQVTGEGNTIDLVLAPGTVSHLASPWQSGNTVQIDRFSRFARLIRFDKRGTGMSDRMTDAATLEERADDIRAVMDAAGSPQAVILGASEGGSMAAVFAALHPERTRAHPLGLHGALGDRSGLPVGRDGRAVRASPDRVRARLAIARIRAHLGRGAGRCSG